MSNQKTASLTIKLATNIPSKKNSRINLRNGISIPSKAYREWHDEAVVMSKIQAAKQDWAMKQGDRAKITGIIYCATLRKTDIDNKLSSFLDMIVDANIIPDDNWQTIPEITIKADYRKGQPGAEFVITML